MTKVVSLLHQVNPQHGFQRVGRAAAFGTSFCVVELNQIDHRFPQGHLKIRPGNPWRGLSALGSLGGSQCPQWPKPSLVQAISRPPGLDDQADPRRGGGLDLLVCDGKTLRGSAIETEEGYHRFVAQVTVYARALGVALVKIGL
jgi:hypothetical protein